MCGFFAFSTGMSSREIAELFELEKLPRSIEDIQSLKFFPKATIPTISKNSPNQLVMRYWSLIPRWWKKDLSELKFSTFNARAEDIEEKATYRTAWQQSQRCLIPSSWFYEFKAEKIDKKTIKVPYRVESSDEPIITLAGLYETWEGTDGKTVESTTIITTAAVGPLLPVHDRQPVIIQSTDRERWLSKTTSAKEAKQMLQPHESLKVRELDRAFNKAFGSEVTGEMVLLNSA